ncbi:xanthine dehydrogenase family protein molybdopterin-binding subunit [Algicella marina]|uniref:Molybdopterin-dependent oxidoreductase n=1 Tax=Algicella marina TaxID=2683284 RepID=A0A6P1STD5_9RHOB|nr:molybdopterin cofactor-binding domain-containing protein [Algicella marina]QHQ33688.1 molybdopterin-dependent oxidoreductase [Algicella marina]
MTIATSRRGFLRGTAAVAGAFAIGFTPEGVLANSETSPVALNPFVRVGTDGTVTAILKHFEMGQGTTTGLTTIIAEEMDADWETILFDFAPADETYNNTLMGAQGTGGSTAIANSWMQYRQAGAAARAMFVAAAAAEWGVEPGDVQVSKGVLTSGDRRGTFADFVAAASAMEAPSEPRLKDPSEFTLIGQNRLSRKDSIAKTDGTAQFAMDVQLPGMVYANVLRCPNQGGKLTSFDASAAEGLHGYLDAKALPDNSGVVVYATSTWAAFQARQAITAEWDLTAAETRSTDAIKAEHMTMLETPELEARPGADRTAVEAAVQAAPKKVEADFFFPYLTHSPMEPLNCTVAPTENGVMLYDGCQFPTISKAVLAAVLGLEPEQVEITTLYAGGSFGRRANFTADYNAEAAMAFALYGDQTPVKLVWMREDDFPGGQYRPMAAHRLSIGIGDDGKITGWDHRIATQSIFKGTAMESFVVHNGIDHTSVEGIADTHYDLPVMSVGLTDAQTPNKVLWWRSVGNTHTAYAMEVGLDMAAEALGRDPVDLRLELLSGEDTDRKRLTGVLRLVADKSGWDTPAPEGRFRGVAVHKSFSSYVAQVAEVSLRDGAVKIEKITCAVDCGVAINPDVIRAQMEGGIGYGIGAAMLNEVTFTDGAADQTNFHDYELLRISDIGEIEVHIVPSTEAPTGVGEPGLPPALPAVANAIYKATGTRLTELPWIKSVDFA